MQPLPVHNAMQSCVSSSKTPVTFSKDRYILEIVCMAVGVTDMPTSNLEMLLGNGGEADCTTHIGPASTLQVPASNVS